MLDSTGIYFKDKRHIDQSLSSHTSPNKESPTSNFKFSIMPDDCQPTPQPKQDLTTIPLFIKCGLQIDYYFNKSFELLQLLIPKSGHTTLKYPKEFVASIRTSMSNASICINKVKRSY